MARLERPDKRFGSDEMWDWSEQSLRDAVAATHLRLAAHRVADWVYEQLTGTPGAFASRIAYITRQSSRHVLWVADADGEGAQQALASQEPIISPRWSPAPLSGAGKTPRLRTRHRKDAHAHHPARHPARL